MLGIASRPAALLRRVNTRPLLAIVRVSTGASSILLRPAVPRALSTTSRVTQRTAVSGRRVNAVVHGMASDSVEGILEADSSGADMTVHELVRNDHNSFRGLLWKYHLAHSIEVKQSILHNLIQDIHIHSAAEELVVHPILVHLAQTLHTRKPSINMLHLQHESIKDTFLELSKMISTLNLSGESDRKEIEKMLSRGMRMLDEHMRIEELDIVALTETVSESDLLELGNVFDKVKKTSILAPSDGNRFHVAATIPTGGNSVLHGLRAKITAMG